MKVKITVTTEMYTMPSVEFASYEEALAEVKFWMDGTDECPIHEINIEFL